MKNGLPHEGNIKGADIVALDVQGTLIQIIEPLWKRGIQYHNQAKL